MKGLELFNLCFSSRAVAGFAAVDSGRSRRGQVSNRLCRESSARVRILNLNSLLQQDPNRRIWPFLGVVDSQDMQYPLQELVC